MIKPIAPQEALQAAQPALALVKQRLGRIPNMYRVMAHSPAVLDSYVKLNSALSAGAIGNPMAERIALVAAAYNHCAYCLAAHTFLGSKAGLSGAEIEGSRAFHSEDLKVQAGLDFVKKILETPQRLSPKDVVQLRSAGYTDGNALEIIANVVRNLFTNYVNLVSETEVDWPAIDKTE